MTGQIRDFPCPTCGAQQPIDAKACRYCGNPVVITTFSEVRDWDGAQLAKYSAAYEQALNATDNPEFSLALAVCLLKFGQHQRALQRIEAALHHNVHNSEAYFFSAVARLGGKRPALGRLHDMNAALNDLASAKQLERRGSYHYLAYLILSDFHERKHLRTAVTAAQELQSAYDCGLSQEDIRFVNEIVSLTPA